MPRVPALEEDDGLAAPRGKPLTREKFKAALERRYSPRLHMSMILAASGFCAMLASWFLLAAGVHSMLVRYPIAIAIAYATFLVGVYVWLRAMGFVDNDGASTGKRRSANGSFDIPTLSGGGGGGGGGPAISIPKGGGGTFDGGGASGSFAGGRMPLVATNLQAEASDGLKSAGGKAAGSLLDGIDGDGLVLLLLALVLVAAIFATSGYLIWVAPDVLTEAAFGAMLTGTLVRTTRKQTAAGWIGGVVRKTLWPFLVVMVVAMVFAGWSAHHYPEAGTFREALAAAVR